VTPLALIAMIPRHAPHLLISLDAILSASMLGPLSAPASPHHRAVNLLPSAVRMLMSWSREQSRRVSLAPSGAPLAQITGVACACIAQGALRLCESASVDASVLSWLLPFTGVS
jgi:hypothetical protein